MKVVPAGGRNVQTYAGSSLWHWWLAPAVAAAKAAGAVLVAATMCRLRRPEDFDSKKDFDRPLTAHDLDELLRWTEGVSLFTIEEPDAPPHDNRSAQTKRGMAAKGQMGGRANRRERPPEDDAPTPRQRTRFRERWLPVVLDRHARGESAAAIEKRLREESGYRVTRATVLNWIKKAKRIPGRG
jgi:hypothetical protein